MTNKNNEIRAEALNDTELDEVNGGVNMLEKAIANDNMQVNKECGLNKQIEKQMQKDMQKQGR